MNLYQERAREHFPSVLLGVLGIIQALALEILWEDGVGGIDRWHAIHATVTGWLQILAMFLGIVVVWVMYATMVLRFSWVPRFFDLAFPFLLGVMEFGLAALCGPEDITGFFVLLAVVFVVSAGTTFSIYRTLFAAGDAPPIPLDEQLKGYIPAAVATVMLLICAALVHRAGPASTTAAACLVVANGGLLLQLWTFRFFWNQEMRKP